MNANMTPIDWMKRPLQKYADFSGRAPRAEYWWWTLAVIIVFVAVSFVETTAGLNNMIGPYGPLTLVLMLGCLVPGIAVGVRRLHDTNRTGWWILLPIVPYLIGFLLAGPALMGGSMTGLGTAGIFLMIGFVAAIVLLIFYVLPGTPGENRFGPNPYGNGGAAAAA